MHLRRFAGLAETQQALIEDYISAPAQRCDGLDESAMAHPLANQREPFSDRENYDAGAQGIHAFIRFVSVRRRICVNCSTNPESRGLSNAVAPR
jgi:hypothetical protein